MTAANDIVPGRRLGLIPHRKSSDELLAVRWATSPLLYRPAVDNMTGVVAGLDGNDHLGDCGPTAADNHQRITTKAESGSQFDATLSQVLALYTAASHPPFDPATGANDNGVQMPDLLSAMRTSGLGGHRIVAFGRLADTSDASLYTAIDLFGAVLIAVDLQLAQRAQSDRPNPMWDYVPGSGEWGGHAAVLGAYDSATGIADCFSWKLRIGLTAAFRRHRLVEVWVPLYQSVVDSDAFNRTVAVAELAAGFERLTNGQWPGATPTPGPTPPPSAVDWQAAVRTFLGAVPPEWMGDHHVGGNRTVERAVEQLKAATGL